MSLPRLTPFFARTLNDFDRALKQLFQDVRPRGSEGAVLAPSFPGVEAAQGRRGQAAQDQRQGRVTTLVRQTFLSANLQGMADRNVCPTTNESPLKINGGDPQWQKSNPSSRRNPSGRWCRCGRSRG